MGDYFVDGLGYNEQSVYLAATRKQRIYTYVQSCVIHRDTIGWDEEKQKQVEEIAHSIFAESVSAGKCFGLINSILENYSLPDLGSGLYWTRPLLVDILISQGRFRVLGNRKNAFVPIPNNLNIETFDDLLCELLKRNHLGSANLESFGDDLREQGIVIKSVTESMLGKSRKVRIDGKEILLKELAYNA